MKLIFRLTAKQFFAFGIVIVLPFFAVACRQAPENPPKYYEAELRAMRKEQLREAASEAEKSFIPDGYPWEGKTKDKPDVPCSIYKVEKPIEYELDYLYEFVHGKKRKKRRLRD
jgi:hypothetical protein